MLLGYSRKSKALRCCSEPACEAQIRVHQDFWVGIVATAEQRAIAEL